MTPGFVSFGLFTMDGPGTADKLSGELSDELTDWVGDAPGLVSVRVHTGLESAVVAIRQEWADEAARDDGLLSSVAGRPGVLGTAVLAGRPADGIEGPDAGRPPSVAVVATRHLGGPESASTLLDLLAGTGEWKRDFPGFVSAIPYVSPDGRTYVNYPTWTSEAAYRAWMADPRIAEGQAEIARFEVAPPEFVLLAVRAEVET